jgi:hypothetical protein
MLYMLWCAACKTDVPRTVGWTATCATRSVLGMVDDTPPPRIVPHPKAPHVDVMVASLNNRACQACVFPHDVNLPTSPAA